MTTILPVWWRKWMPRKHSEFTWCCCCICALKILMRRRANRFARRLISIFSAQMQQQHHVNSECFRGIHFRHHTGNIVVIQQIYLQIEILIFLHFHLSFIIPHLIFPGRKGAKCILFQLSQKWEGDYIFFIRPLPKIINNPKQYGHKTQPNVGRNRRK